MNKKELTAFILAIIIAPFVIGIFLYVLLGWVDWLIGDPWNLINNRQV